MHNRIKKYEFRRRGDSLRLILWAPLERGGQTAVGSVTLHGSVKPSDLVGTPTIQALIPERLRR